MVALIIALVVVAGVSIGLNVLQSERLRKCMEEMAERSRAAFERKQEHDADMQRLTGEIEQLQRKVLLYERRMKKHEPAEGIQKVCSGATLRALNERVNYEYLHMEEDKRGSTAQR